MSFIEVEKYTLEFRDKAVRQFLERGYSVKEISDRLGVEFMVDDLATECDITLKKLGHSSIS